MALHSHKTDTTEFSSNFVDRDYELATLRTYISNRMCCQVVGPSGIGKSSILYRLRECLQDESSILKIAYIDLSAEQHQTVSGLIRAMSDCWDKGHEVSSVIEFSEQVRGWLKDDARLVLCLDGFEELTKRPGEFTSDFYLDMRSVAQAGVSFITTSLVPLSSLIPSISPVSPFFGLFAVLRLGPLNLQDSEDLLLLKSGSRVLLSADERRLIVQLAKGYPARLEMVYQFVVEHRQGGDNIEVALARAAFELGKLDSGLSG